MTADRPASYPLPTQMKLSLKGITMATGMEVMQAAIHLIPSFSRLPNIPTIRMTVSQTVPLRSLQDRLQQMTVEWIPMILKKHLRSAEKMILRITSLPSLPSLPSHPWMERMIPMNRLYRKSKRQLYQVSQRKIPLCSSPLKCRRLPALQSLPLPILPGSFQKTGKIQCKAL